MPTFQDTQTDDYLALTTDRARNQYLTWVEQALDLIEENLGADAQGSVNDVGCNLGHFYKGLKRRDLRLDYRGYDIEQVYLNEAVKLFPELNGRLDLLDITEDAPQPADVSVMSATLEHLESTHPALDNFLEGTSQLAVLRAFLGDRPLRSMQMVEGAKRAFPVNQLAFQDVLDAFAAAGFWPTVVRDRYTDSMPLYMRNGIIRTYHVVVGSKSD